MRSREIISVVRALRKTGKPRLALRFGAQALKTRKHSKRKSKAEQVELTGLLQDLILEDFARMLREGQMTPTDRATLVRLLASNGWNLDPQSIPQGLRGVLTAVVKPGDLDDEEAA